MEPKADVAAPSYSTLLDWWDAWPEAKVELLDFWARGNYTRRLLSRATSQRGACLVRVNYLDEVETVAKRLSLLDLELDVAWHGDIARGVLAIAPQDIDYEDAGGWGYATCAGDEMDGRGGKEWCPSMGWANLLPDSLVNWLATEGKESIRTGDLMVAPAINIGLSKHTGGQTEERLQRLSNSASLIGDTARVSTLLTLELPYLERMSLADMHKFRQDNQDSLLLFQAALSKIIKQAPGLDELSLANELRVQIEQGVAELRLSDRTASARRTLAHMGVGLSTALVTVGLKLGLKPEVAALGVTGAAIAAVNQYSQILESRGQMRKNPFYIAWKLGRGHTKPKVNKPPVKPKHESKRPTSPEPNHWLSPPEPGWVTPTVLLPQ